MNHETLLCPYLYPLLLQVSTPRSRCAFVRGTSDVTVSLAHYIYVAAYFLSLYICWVYSQGGRRVCAVIKTPSDRPCQFPCFPSRWYIVKINYECIITSWDVPDQAIPVTLSLASWNTNWTIIIQDHLQDKCRGKLLRLCHIKISDEVGGYFIGRELADFFD